MNINDFQLPKINEKQFYKAFCQRRRATIDLKELQTRYKESVWIGEFLSYCEKNNVEKTITYIVPKNSRPCPCRRFKKLYNKYFKRIDCSQCDLMTEYNDCWKITTVTLSEPKVNKLKE